MKAARFLAGLAFLGFMTGLAGTAHAGTDLHLLGERFRVSATWHTPDGASGAAQAWPLTGETGLFSFFSESNVELVVKVLDACAPPFERYWIYASGLTDVEVELTVQDTLTGESKTYRRPGGTLFAPLADTSTFRCGVTSPCGQGTIEQIMATPRRNEEAEGLALLLGPGFTADPAIYARLVDDLARIRSSSPAVSTVEFIPVWDPFTLLFSLTPSAHAQLQAGQYDEWSCLNRWYRGKVDLVFSFPGATVQLAGMYHPYRIGPDYAALPGVLGFESNDLDWAGGVGPPTGICAKIDGTTYHYFFDDFRQGLSWYFRVPQAGAAPVAVGNVGPTGPRPDWWPLREQCRAELAAAARH